MNLFTNNLVDKQILCNNHLKLQFPFYNRSEVLIIAKELLGKILVTRFNNNITAARIAETEAYNGIIDKASHAFGGRRTGRTEIMYAAGGTAYIYLCYGIHNLFNVVTNSSNIPHAILVRAAVPVYGIETMLLRTKKQVLDNTLTRGPGNVSKALGITTMQTGASLFEKEMYIIDDGFLPGEIKASVRIGVDYAEEDALLPYRFYIKNNAFVSGKKKL